MKMGFVTALLGEYNFEQVIDTAGRLGYECVEIACWPGGAAERRYAGVSHIDVDSLDDAKIAYIKNYCKERGVEISSLAFYPNNLDGDLEKREFNISHLKKVIKASARLGVNMVTTFIGRDQYKSVEDNMEIFKQVWPPIIKFAEENGVRVGIENCPMLFDHNQWPGGWNLASTPKIWREMFKVIDSDYFGLNYDPSHLVIQMMDPIAPIWEFRKKIIHVHFKDTKIYREKLNDIGSFAAPNDYMAPKLPGLGDINWGDFVAALNDIGFDGYACIEVEDRAFEVNTGAKLKSLELSKRYLEQFVI
ncbi:MAG: sugar phosphate isomerase/epimerase [Oscillospiraceae bacterium]|nr:sugar phosphate isomerase/epimerase [Oscillospiraceae bacterium]